eukprot:scpid85408/ scgid27267/ 
MFQWKASQLATLLQDTEAQIGRLKSTMLQVSAAKIDRSSILTSVGSQAIARKLALIGTLTSETAHLQRVLEKAIDRLQIRNSQMNSRGTTKSGKNLTCLNCPELTWDEATSDLLQSKEQQHDVGTPLTADQLLSCAAQMSSTNALPLRDIVSSLGIDEGT